MSAADKWRPAETLPRTNPFSTRFIQPGALPFLFPADVNASQLVARLAQQEWWGEIIGPHGSGKSTLLASLTPELCRANRRVVQITLHDGERTLRAHNAAIAGIDSQTVLIVDGYEQLWIWNRYLLRRFCRKRRSGLLVTAHSGAGLPALFETRVDRRTASAVLARLCPDGDVVNQSDLDRALAAHGQDLREALFELYDLYEQRHTK